MAVSKTTKVLGINDAVIFQITQDDASGYKYSAGVDIAGIRKLSFEPQFTAKELRGDEQIIDRYSKLDSINWSFENAKISLDALAVMIGGTVGAITGTAPNDSVTYSVKSTDIPNYFKLEAQAVYGDNGDTHVVLYKCKAESVKFDLVGEEYAVVTASGTAIPSVNTSSIKDIVLNGTKIAIVTSAKTT